MVFPLFNPNSFWSFGTACEAAGARCPAPPLGLITLAALLPQTWEFRLINRNAEPLDDEDLRWADLVMTGGMLPQQLDTLAIVSRCKDLQHLGFKPMSFLSLPVSTLGAPRIGPRRELKAALESYWSGKSDAAALLEIAAVLRAANWTRQHALGVANIPSNDFSLYDHVLDTSVMVGVIPDGYGWDGGKISLDAYFAMARGSHGFS